MIENPRMVFPTDISRNRKVSSEIAYVTQCYPLRRGTSARWLHAPAQIIVVADVIEVVSRETHETSLLLTVLGP